MDANKIFISLVFFLSLMSCSQKEDMESALKCESDVAESEYAVSLEDALKIADSYFVAIDENTRSYARKFASVEFIESTDTRSSDSSRNPMYYIVNYQNDEGFAILSADKRLPAVFAISESGQLNIKDTIDNPGLKIFIDNLPKSATGIKKVVGNGDVIVTGPVLTVVVHPLASNAVRKWNQFKYNKYVRKFYNNNLRTPVGCTVVATGIIMSCFKYPSSITLPNEGTYYFDWTKINAGYTDDTTTDQICRLFEILGREDFLKATYGFITTAPIKDNYKQTYESFGYANTKMAKPFNEGMTQYQLLKGSPIEVCGSNTTAGYGAHCWVIDGYAEPNPLKVVDSNGNITYVKSTNRYYHCVWCNGGNSNGYYLFIKDSEMFDDESSMHESDEIGNSIGSNYGHETYMFYDFTPRNR